MKTREQIITDMCCTWRHDYWNKKDYAEVDSISSGMTDRERKMLWNAMAQLFDNNIAPHMEFKHTATSKNICGND